MFTPGLREIKTFNTLDDYFDPNLNSVTTEVNNLVNLNSSFWNKMNLLRMMIKIFIFFWISYEIVIGHLNVNSLRNKFYTLKPLLQDIDIDNIDIFDVSDWLIDWLIYYIELFIFTIKISISYMLDTGIFTSLNNSDYHYTQNMG